MRLRALLPLLLAPTLAAAQNDAAYGAKIKEYTTESFFTTELVDHLPASSKVPSPLKHFGTIIGAPNVLHYVDEINGYMRALDAASPRIVVESMGMSEEGREMIAVIISDEANLKNLGRHRQLQGMLGDPRKLVAGGYKGDGKLTGADEKADQIIEEALPIYFATGGMHSPEAGPPEMLMELAYRLAVEETTFIKAIRKNSIVVLTPVLDTDGRDRYVDTYMYRKKNPTKPPIPLLYWGKYVAHDNNRDGMALSLALSRNLMNFWWKTYPTVLHDLHQSVPFLYISTGTGPYNAWLDPITIDEWHILAYHEVNELTKRGVPGVWTHGFYDGWAPNYAFYAANGHNAIGRFYETFGQSGADTTMANVGQQSQRAWFRPNPPFSRVRWSLRNNTNLMQSGVLMGMHHLATEKEKFLKNYYLKAKRSVLKPWNEGPAAYFIAPKKGRDWNAQELEAMLRRQGIELHKLDTATKVGDTEYPAGSTVIRMDQPFSRMADMLLDKQFYRADDPSPYDDTGWTLGPLFDTNTARVKERDVLARNLQAHTPAGDFNAFPGGAGNSRIALVHTWQNTQDEGWFRLAFEAAKVPYKYVSVHELRDTPNLKAKYDTIILGPVGGSAQSFVNGVSKEGEPIPWKPLDGFKHLGGPDQTDNIRGGVELTGMLNLQKFLQEGGLLICIGTNSRVATDYGLVSGVTMTEPRELFAPGGVFLTEKIAKDSPVLKGYDDNVPVYFNAGRSVLMSVGGGGGGGGGQGGGAGANRPSGRGDRTDPDVVQGRAPYTPVRQPTDEPEGQNQQQQNQAPRPQVLLRFAPADKVLLSGALDHGDELAGRAALVLCPVGKGNVLLFANNPMWRQQTQGSWPMIFNAAANWDKLRPAPAATPPAGGGGG